MIEKVFSISLPVNEKLVIRRNRIEPEIGQENRGRVSIVTGAHGDELEGQYVCYELIRRLKGMKQKLRGTVDIYPAINPLGMDMGSRMVPKIDMDLNRMFPGKKDGTAMERVAAGIIDALVGSEIVIDVHSSDTFVKEIPQARLSEEFENLMLPYAKHLNVDIIWINQNATVHEASLAYSLCKLGTPALMMEMGLGNRINREYGLQIVDGIIHLLHHLELLVDEDVSVNEPPVIRNEDIEFIRAGESGIFLPSVENDVHVEKGDKLGDIMNPIFGDVLYEVRAENSGRLFTLREHPLAYEGSVIARIIRD